MSVATHRDLTSVNVIPATDHIPTNTTVSVCPMIMFSFTRFIALVSSAH